MFLYDENHRLGEKGINLNITKAIYDKTISNIVINGENCEKISIEIRNKTTLPTLWTMDLYSD